MAKPHVLIVDDSPANLKVARVALEADGYEVHTATDGEEAWRLLENFKPGSILMDLQLPGLDGFELTRRIKADPDLRHIPVIAVTAYAMKGDRERALAVGCDDYIAKPVDPIALPALVATHLPRSPPFARANGESADARILVVEDNPTTRKLLRVTLECEGFRVSEAAQARDALCWIEHHRPLLVLQDLMLPDMDGLELVRQLRETPNGRSVPVVCLSGFISQIDDARAMAHSFSALLIKPVDPARLIEVVRRHLTAPRSRPPSAAAGAGPRVLLVDDDPLQRRLAEFELASDGMRVTAVASAKLAIAEAERERPDAIVSDVLMSELDGFELCLQIRHHPTLAELPVVLVSSHYAERSDRALAAKVGADALVARSGDQGDLTEQLRRALERKAAPRPSAEHTETRDAVGRRTLHQLDRQLLANRRLHQQCMYQSAQLSVIARVAEALTRHAKLGEVLDDALSVCLDLAGISKGVLYLHRDGALAPTHHFGFGAHETSALLRFFGYAELLDEIVARREVRAIPSDGLSPARAADLLFRAGLRAALIVPVTRGDQTYGALVLGARTAEIISAEAMTFAHVLGGQLGQAIELANTFERLHASEQKFRGLVDSMDIVTVLDREQRITDTYGRTLDRADPTERAALIGKTMQELSPHERQAHAAAHARAFAGESVLYEWSHTSEPNAHHLLSTVFPVRDADGVVRSIVRVTRDVTQQKQLQTQILMSDRMASVGMLAAGVAHEINSPLMTVLGNLQLALGAPNGNTGGVEQLELLRDALEAAQRAGAIVRDLRLFSRTEKELVTAVDVHAVLDSTLRMARNEIRHRARLVRAFAEVPAVRANASRLGQVFLNLLLNAAQAIPDGRADENEIRVSTYADGPDRVFVEVADTGRGIPEELQSRLFTPFVTSKPVGIGTGLGLAICQRIVTALGGSITFESTRGRTIFRVQLRTAHEPFRPVSQPPPSPLDSVAAPRRGKVLLIDDDVALCRLLQRSLSKEHEVVWFADAREALARIGADASFDVILCDVMMPRMTGAEFYQELEGAHPELAARTVLLTGGAFTPGAREFVERLGRRCLEKPFDLVALRKFINDRVK